MSGVLALSAKRQTDGERDDYAETKLEVVMYWRGRSGLAAAALAAGLVFAARLIRQLRQV
jgi:hypothetical protein